MKKLLLAIAVAAIFSCSKDDEVCGKVTGRSVLYGNENTYYLVIDGNQKEVSYDVYKANSIGSYICL